MPSAKVLEQKQKVVADLAERIKSSAAGVLVNYQGITVADDTALRAELRKAGVNYTVIKNTLISKACDIVGFEGLKDVLSGMTAIATSEEDAVARRGSSTTLQRKTKTIPSRPASWRASCWTSRASRSWRPSRRRKC